MGLVLGAVALALGLAWSAQSHAQSSQSPSNVAPTFNRVVTPQAPSAVGDNAKAAAQGQPGQQGMEKKDEKAKDKAKDKAKTTP
jgi:hypothetical protein